MKWNCKLTNWVKLARAFNVIFAVAYDDDHRCLRTHTHSHCDSRSRIW